MAHVLLEEIFPRFSCPLRVVSDNGTENINQIVRETLKSMNVQHVFTSLYHPQSNAKVERFHRTLHDILAKKIQDNPSTWDVYLNQVLAAVRFNNNESTKYSPYFLLYTRDVVLPIDNLLRPRRKYLGEDHHEIALERQHQAFVEVHRRMKKARERQAKYANKNSKPVEITVGDPVYLKNHQRKNKLDKKWSPYYRVVKQTTPVTFVIKNQLTGDIQKAHVENLRLANIDEWEIPRAVDGRAIRRAQYAVPPESSGDDTDSESEQRREMEEERPPDLSRRFRREREDSSSEDDIPLMELTRRVRARDRAVTPSAEGMPQGLSDSGSSSPSTITQGDDASQLSEADNLSSTMEVDAIELRHMRRRKTRDKGQAVKRLLSAIIDVL